VDDNNGLSESHGYGADYCRAFEATQSSDEGLFGWLYQERIRATVRAVRRQVSLGGSVVDLGCASGSTSLALAHAGFNVTGVELNPAFLDYARRREDVAVAWVCADLMVYQSEQLFDVAVMGELVEHSGVPERLVAATMRLVRPGGLLVLTTPNGQRLRQSLPTFGQWAEAHPDRAGRPFLGPGGEHHEYLFTRAELARLVHPGFERLKFQPLGSIVFNRVTEPFLGARVGRVLLTGIQAVATAIDRDHFANGWLVTARRRSHAADETALSAGD
jgi:2-polyprenyl-3-methyl-5-hydroxy-6-metoxy-1,4-benzoquinol methylase